MESAQPVHPEASLLPAYVSRTLSPEEHQQVEHHLQACASCQREYEEVQTMRSALKTVIQKRPGPSSAAFKKVMNRIHQENRHLHNEAQKETSWWDAIEKTFRFPFEIKWVPVLASFLIVGQTILLLSINGGPDGQVASGPGSVIERGIPQGPSTVSPIKIQVAFVETAQEHQIREIIHQFDGKIIDGPSSEGWYLLSFPRKDSMSTDLLLTSLKNHPNLIRSAQPFLSS